LAAEARKAQAAQTQFARAEKLQSSLHIRQPESRTRQDYQRVITAYRRVYYLDPTSAKAPASVLAVAELLAQAGRQFDEAEKLRAAIGQYKFLLREYPGYRYRGSALLAMGKIYKEDLNQPTQAKPIFQQFLKEYPHSSRADEARQALGKSRPAPPEAAKAPSSPPNSDSDLARMKGIRYWSTPDYSRVAVDLDSDITFHSERLRNPDRVIFDLHWTRLASSLENRNINPRKGLLKKVGIFEKGPGDTRLVLEVNDLADYSAFLLPNPDRLIIDMHGREASAANLRTPSSKVADSVRPSDPAADSFALTTSVAGTRKNPVGPRIITDDDGDNSTRKPPKSRRADVLPPSATPPARVVISEGGEQVQAREARPTSSGDRSLIRALGLKVGKIVIDPGHGGHDTGTIGSNGLEEKDLVLDVSLRLGKLLQQRLGADVVYTRDDDTFVPLETRTAIANQAEADLFVSVHANSSQNPESRGVETYYLNFTTSSDALEVAARENAVSDQSIHQLQQLVKNIALQEKVEESREFAADVQHALYTGLVSATPAIQNRGVKKAPFVVLIGAKMPSILAEISFVSNPQDERKLRSPAYRQRIALALYRGIARYANGLSGIKVASSVAQGDGQ
jgi:N-acetylmuramoyl-L-alanine amidase